MGDTTREKEDETKKNKLELSLLDNLLVPSLSPCLPSRVCSGVVGGRKGRSGVGEEQGRNDFYRGANVWENAFRPRYSRLSNGEDINLFSLIASLLFCLLYTLLFFCFLFLEAVIAAFRSQLTLSTTSLKETPTKACNNRGSPRVLISHILDETKQCFSCCHSTKTIHIYSDESYQCFGSAVVIVLLKFNRSRQWC